MTHLQTYPFIARDRRTTAHRVLASLVGLATLVYAGLALWAALATYQAGVTATLDEDTSLYGLGYLLAMVAGVAALVCAVGGLAGWRVARRCPDAGTGVLVCALVLGLVPLGLLVG